MSLEELIERRLSSKIIPRRVPLSQEVRRSIYLLVFSLLSIIIVLNVIFLQNTSMGPQKGIILEEMQYDKENLIQKNKELTTKKIEAESLQRLEESEQVKQMQEPENIIYVQPKQ